MFCTDAHQELCISSDFSQLILGCRHYLCLQMRKKTGESESRSQTQDTLARRLSRAGMIQAEIIPDSMSVTTLPFSKVKHVPSGEQVPLGSCPRQVVRYLAELGRPASADCPVSDKTGCWGGQHTQVWAVRKQLKIMTEGQNGLEVAQHKEAGKGLVTLCVQDSPDFLLE